MNGQYRCEDCGKGFDSISGLGGHKRFCDPVLRAGGGAGGDLAGAEDWELMREAKKKVSSFTQPPPTPAPAPSACPSRAGPSR